ncbi:MAG: AAA family ATPase [Anaerolineae bacterium]|nr:AAA family ATPase [Anaerolineae bacterium]
MFALENLGVHQESAGDLQQALLTTRRLILVEPFHEPAHAMYLRLLGRLQRYGEALAHYDYFRQLLKTELDAEPLSETQHLIQVLEQERALTATPLTTKEHSLFIGRVVERATLLEAIEGMLQGKGGMIAVEGEPGIGKSRLLREISSSARWRGATVLQERQPRPRKLLPFQHLWRHCPHC